MSRCRPASPWTFCVQARTLGAPQQGRMQSRWEWSPRHLSGAATSSLWRTSSTPARPCRCAGQHCYGFWSLQQRLMTASVTLMGARTVQELCGRLRAQGAASVAVIALLDKAARRTVDLTPDYRGFEVTAPPPVPHGKLCKHVRTCMSPACAWTLLVLHKCAAQHGKKKRADAVG